MVRPERRVEQVDALWREARDREEHGALGADARAALGAHAKQVYAPRFAGVGTRLGVGWRVRVQLQAQALQQSATQLDLLCPAAQTRTWARLLVAAMGSALSPPYILGPFLGGRLGVEFALHGDAPLREAGLTRT